MRNVVTSSLAAILLVSGLVAGQIIKNPDFSRLEPGTTKPVEWNIPDNQLWSVVQEDGPEGAAWLQYRADEKTRSAPVTQQCGFIEPARTYTLSLRVKSTGGLRPVIRAIDRLTHETLGSVVAESHDDWRTVRFDFEPKNADVTLELYADLGHVEDTPVPAGSAGFAHIVLQEQNTSGEKMPDLGENIALNQPYELSRPNYGLCSDEEDDIQLTDGAYTEGYFWTQKSTVGWSGRGPRYVTIDLGKDRSIGALSVSTAAGVAGVHWPKRILVFVSPEGEQWYPVGDLIELHTQREPLPAYGEYTTRRIWTDQLQTHGRYVQLWIEPSNNYVFADEIEVYRGDEAWLHAAYTGPAIDDVPQYMDEVMITDLIREQFRRDLQAVEEDIGNLSGPEQEKHSDRAAALHTAIDDMKPVSMKGFRAVLPMTDLEADIFRLQAAVWRSQGKPSLRLWKNHRWDPLAPSAEPENDAQPVLEVHMMKNEHRADVLNLTNARSELLRCRVRMDGIAPLETLDDVTVHEVLTVGTRWFIAVSAALPEARRAGREFVVQVPPGMTRQVWFSFNPRGWEPGDYEGEIQVRAGRMPAQTVPLKIHISPVRFPDRTTLHLGGWTYTDSNDAYGVTPQNHAAIVKTLKEHYVNAPWASGNVTPVGEYDGEGTMTGEPDTGDFDEFVKLWPNAKKYMIFEHVGRSFAGSEMGTDMFEKKVGNWAHFWAGHMRDLDLNPDQLALLLVDEPHSTEQYETTIGWAQTINSAEPEIVIFCDPQPKDEESPLEMFGTVDILCPFRRPFLSRPEWYRKMFYRFRDRGTELWFYDASGPARTFDPYTFYLLQEWLCFDRGATGSAFWAFGDNGRVSCWNEYPAKGNGPYTPLYVDDESVTDAKYMEAIREGVQDYQYLVMLRSRINELTADGVEDRRIDEAREVLQSACDRALKPDEITKYRWDEPKDRAVVDAVRRDLLEALAKLQDLQESR